MSDSSNKPAQSGRWLLIPIAGSLILMGLLFMVLMGRSYLRAKQMRDWPSVPCIVLQSTLEERQHDPYSPVEYRHRISYGYEWKDQALTSDSITLRGSKWSNKTGKAKESQALYPAGSEQTCHVNPANPTQAVLELDSLAPLYSIWFPAVFAIGGMVLLIRCIRPPRRALSR